MVLILPAIIPLLKITGFSGKEIPNVPSGPISTIITVGASLEETISGNIASFNYEKLFVFLYFAIAGLLVLRIIISLARTFVIISKGTLFDNTFPKVIISDLHHPPFSFFPFTVIPRNVFKSENFSEILNHEKVHINQGHTFDLLLSELFAAFQWFNPIAWLIKKSVIMNHEFLADHVSIMNVENIKDYQYRLMEIPVEFNNVPMSHNYNGMIKQRIFMINRKATNTYAALKTLLILPVILIIIMALSGTKDSTGKKIGTPVFKENMQTFEADEITYNFETNKGLIKDIKLQDKKAIQDTTKAINPNTINSKAVKSTIISNEPNGQFFIRDTKPRILVDGLPYKRTKIDINPTLIKSIQISSGDKYMYGVINISTKSDFSLSRTK